MKVNEMYKEFKNEMHKAMFELESKNGESVFVMDNEGSCGVFESFEKFVRSEYGCSSKIISQEWDYNTLVVKVEA